MSKRGVQFKRLRRRVSQRQLLRLHTLLVRYSGELQERGYASGRRGEYSVLDHISLAMHQAAGDMLYEPEDRPQQVV